MKKVILISFSFLLVSCSDRLRVLNDEYLPRAHIGEYYQHIINIERMIVVGRTFEVNITPDNSGITWEPNDSLIIVRPIGTKDYSKITIKGKPKASGEIYLDFNWSTVGTNISVGKRYHKRYILKVEE